MMKFEKMQGAGNDYIYVNCFEERIDDPSELARRLSDRHFGVGADGLILICPSSCADFRMRIFNADGSEGKMCGNGVRCVAKYCFEHGMTEKTVMKIETNSGIKTLHLKLDGAKAVSASTQMGRASFERDTIPFIGDEERLVGAKKSFGGVVYNISCVSMGNPHCVIFCADCDSVELEKVGTLIENDAMFPERVNVEFAHMLGKNQIKMRVWERGSGITLACGTGACAVAAAAVALGLCEKEREISVSLPGGELSVLCSSEYDITLSGEAVSVFRGEIRI